MPQSPIHDPGWQAYRHVVKVRFNTDQLNRIDQSVPRARSLA